MPRGQIRSFEHWHFCLPLIPARHQSKQKSQELPSKRKTSTATQFVALRDYIYIIGKHIAEAGHYEHRQGKYKR
jgi:hypothetical protein